MKQHNKTPEKIRFSGNIVVITASPDFHPIRQLKELAKRLTLLKFTGVVLFDLLAVNGLTPNRFVSMKFNQDKFDQNSFQILSHVDPVILEEQDLIIKHNPSLLLDSVLSLKERQKFSL